MGVQMGWPDLTSSRRRSLCDLIDELKIRLEDLDLLEHCLIAQGKFVPVGMMQAPTDQYREVKRIAELQFPEMRIMEGEDVPPCLASSNVKLRSSMKRTDAALAIAIGCTEQELLHFYEHKTLTGSLARNPAPPARRKRVGKARSTTKTKEMAK